MATDPYYKDDSCTIYHADCRDLLPGMTFDAVVTDPPYGTGYYRTDVDVVDVLAHLPKPCAIFGWPERLVDVCRSRDEAPDEWITWWPKNAAVKAAPSKDPLRESECIAIYGRGEWERVKIPRTATYIGMYACEGDRGTSHGDRESRYIGDVWTQTAPGVGFLHGNGHPNEKPLVVIGRLVAVLSDPGQVVLDPFMGSGTTLRAAKDLGRKAIGIEIEEKYCEIAARRLAQEVLPLAGM